MYVYICTYMYINKHICTCFSIVKTGVFFPTCYLTPFKIFFYHSQVYFQKWYDKIHCVKVFHSFTSVCQTLTACQALWWGWVCISGQIQPAWCSAVWWRELEMNSGWRGGVRAVSRRNSLSRDQRTARKQVRWLGSKYPCMDTLGLVKEDSC